MTKNSNLTSLNSSSTPEHKFYENLDSEELLLACEEIWTMATRAISAREPLPSAGEKTPSGWAVVADLPFIGEGSLWAYAHLWALEDVEGRTAFVVTTMRSHHNAKVIAVSTAQKIVAALQQKALDAVRFAESAHLSHQF